MLDEKLRQKIDLALNFQETDFVPICDFLDNRKIFNYFSHNRELTQEEKVKAYHGLGIDVCWQFERRKEYRHAGFLEKLQRFALRKPKLEVITQTDLALEFEDFKYQQKLFAPNTYLAMSTEGCLSVAYKTLGYEEFCKKMYVELIEVERLIDIFAENLYQRALKFSEQKLGPVFFIKDDIAYDKGLIFSEAFLTQHWLPRIENAIEPLKKSGIKVILHSEGDISSIINKLIDIGIDGIHPVDSRAGMDIGLIKKTYARSLLLFGNVNLSLHADEQSIGERIKKCVKTASFGGGHFIGSLTGIDKRYQLKEILAFFAALNEFGKTTL